MVDKKTKLTPIDDITGKAIKRPRKPTVPYLRPPPEEYMEVNRKIVIYDGDNLAEVLTKLPQDIRHDQFEFVVADEEYDEEEDEYHDGLFLSYGAKKKNQEYVEQLDRYQKDLVVYNEKMVIYKQLKRSYDEWNELSDEEKIKQDRADKIVQANLKISLLQQQIKTLESSTEKSVGI